MRIPQGDGLLVNRSDIGVCKIHRESAGEDCELAQGSILVRVRRFAVTTNNITYAVFGDALGYWTFFPAPEGWGRIPVWGFGEVVESRLRAVEPGSHLFGYFPMPTYCQMSPMDVNRSGFVDGVAHRRTHSVAYNTYEQVIESGSELHWGDENLQVLCRPLFRTAFHLDDLLGENDFFDAETILISSASSKTAISLAHLLKMRGRVLPDIVGLTSASNFAFVESLNCYDDVCTYSDFHRLNAQKKSAYIDVAGDQALRSSVHGHWQGKLQFSLIVGATHKEALGESGDLPGATPTMFFAPDRTEKREREWGPDRLRQRIHEKWQSYVPRLKEWIVVREHWGLESASNLLSVLQSGDTNPREGHVVRL